VVTNYKIVNLQSSDAAKPTLKFLAVSEVKLRLAELYAPKPTLKFLASSEVKLRPAELYARQDGGCKVEFSYVVS
jgi:hypothetical protein